MLYWCQQGQMFVTGAKMRAGREQQPLSYDVRLPDEAQADALRLLDASCVLRPSANGSFKRFSPSSLMVSYGPKKRSAPPPRTARASKRPSPSCKSPLRMTTLAL